jgi:hypothetical protein
MNVVCEDKREEAGNPERKFPAFLPRIANENPLIGQNTAPKCPPCCLLNRAMLLVICQFVVKSGIVDFHS